LNYTYKRLRHQGLPSVKRQGKDDGFPGPHSACRYRENEKKDCPVKCAIGHLIPNGQYHARLEGLTVGGMETIYKDLFDKIRPTDMDRWTGGAFLSDLQLAHDTYTEYMDNPTSGRIPWEDHLDRQYRMIAKEFNLIFPE